ncbi:centrosomal protein [Chloropicon roscoffensis]|uniref:Centrosomal protein n=1 Tax=Chloropicon roscoffensis TaxID=1461544 RepID=A0AAX4P6E0_9CHLO
MEASTTEPSAKPSEGEEPTMQEVSDYAEYLGLRPGEDGELLWIAEQALLSPLPEGWREVEDHKGNVLYLNGETGDAQYDHPCDEEYKGLFHAFKGVLADIVSREEIVEMARYLGIDTRKEQSLLWIARQCVIAPLPHGWEEREDEAKGGAYFYNGKRGATSREHPLDGIFRVLVSTERKKMSEKSLVRAGNTGGKDGVQMRLVRSDGSALYTYDWITGEVTDVHPLNGAAESRRLESMASDLPKNLVEDLQKKGILEQSPTPSVSVSSTGTSAARPIVIDESEPAMPPVAQHAQSGRVPLTSRRTGFPSIQRKKKAQRRANQVRATSSFMPIESLMTILGYANPLAWLLFFFHRIKTMLKR